MKSLLRTAGATAALAVLLSSCGGSNGGAVVPGVDLNPPPPPASCELENITGLAPRPDSAAVKSWKKQKGPIDTATGQPLQGDKLLNHCTTKLQGIQGDYCSEIADKYCNEHCAKDLKVCIETHRDKVIRQCAEQTFPVFAKAYPACCQMKPDEARRRRARSDDCGLRRLKSPALGAADSLPGLAARAEEQMYSAQDGFFTAPTIAPGPRTAPSRVFCAAPGLRAAGVALQPLKHRPDRQSPTALAVHFARSTTQ